MTTKARLTDAAYWQGYWQAGEAESAWVLPERHHIWGRKGSFMRVIRREVQPIDGLRVVELGGGSSLYLAALAKWAGVRATALDFAPAGLARLEEIFRANGLAVDTVLADLFAWDAGGRRFDLVVHWGLLEHFSEPETVLAASRRLLAPGGRVVFTMPNMAAVGARLWKKWAPQNWSTHLYHDDETVRRACESAGLSLRRRFHWGGLLLMSGHYERSGVGPLAARAVERVVSAANHVVPWYHLGHPLLSSSRGFVAELAGPAESR